MSRFAAAGFRVVPVADGKRPACKQATNEREANREKARIQATILKNQLIQGNRELLDLRSRLSHEDYAKMKKELTNVESTMKAKETFSRNTITAGTVELLKKELEAVGACLTSSSGGTIDPVKRAKFQGDSVMIGHISSGVTQMIFSTDADIPMLGGDMCISVREMKGGKYMLVSSSFDTLSHARDMIDEKDRGHTTVTRAKCPIFDGISDRKTRAIMMVILGCAVCAKGIPGVGASSLQSVINEQYNVWKKQHPTNGMFLFLKRFMVKRMRDLARYHSPKMLCTPMSEALYTSRPILHQHSCLVTQRKCVTILMKVTIQRNCRRHRRSNVHE
jgi:hypothetical protein